MGVLIWDYRDDWALKFFSVDDGYWSDGINGYYQSDVQFKYYEPSQTYVIVATHGGWTMLSVASGSVVMVPVAIPIMTA